MQRLPDELFRKGSTGVEEPPVPRRRVLRQVKVEQPAPLPKDGGGMTLRSVVLLVVVSLIVSFVLGWFVLFAGEPAAEPTPVTQSPNPEEFRVYDGAVVAMEAKNAVSDCDSEEGDGNADKLIDADPSTMWRCPGNGEGRSIRFEFDGPVALVGLRLINGNAVDTGRYLKERRITSLRWDFEDGYYFEQGLATNDPTTQEVRFPRMDTSSVMLTVKSSSAPGENDEEHDAVSISGLEFLGPS